MCACVCAECEGLCVDACGSDCVRFYDVGVSILFFIAAGALWVGVWVCGCVCVCGVGVCFCHAFHFVQT